MEIIDVNEKSALKSSYTYPKKQLKNSEISNKINTNKNKEFNYNNIFLKLFILLILYCINKFYIIFEREKNSLNKIIVTLKEEKESLETYNTQLKRDNQRIKKLANITEPKIVAISYGSEEYKQQLEWNKKSALEIAKVDEYYGYGPEDIDPEFRLKNNFTLSLGRGNGYWLWKPYFLLKTLKNQLNEGDYLIYSDASIVYKQKAEILVHFLKMKNAEMYLFRLPFLEKIYTKRDAFILLGADTPFFTETGQFNAAFQIYRKSKFTEIFLEEYLYYAQDIRILTDKPNTLGLPNYKGFYDHRHDQSILSILTKKYGQVNANRMNVDINTVNNFTESMPTIFCHYRVRVFLSYEDLIKSVNNYIYLI